MLNLTSENINYWAGEVQATPKALLISTTAYDPDLRQSLSTVHVVDISDPDATPTVTHHLPIAGHVLNKFNMRLQGDILTVVSQVWRGGTERRRHASVETSDLSDPAAGESGPLGSVEFAQNESITATRFVGAILPDGSLCWHPSKPNNQFFYGGFIGIPVMMDSFMPYYSPGAGQVHTADIADGANPQVLASVNLKSPDQYWSEGSDRLVGSTFYHGYRSSVSVSRPDGTNEWRTNHWLQPLDLSNPAAPVEQDPAKLPGTFEHALRTPSGGLVLFTSLTESSYVEDVWTTEYRVQALAFDGLTACLIDELVVPDRGAGPALFHDQWVMLGRTIYDEDETRTALDIHQWQSAGSFRTVQTLPRPGAIHKLRLANRLLIASVAGGLSFIDFVDPADPDPASVTAVNNRFWGELDRIEIHQRNFAYVPRGIWGGWKPSICAACSSRVSPNTPARMIPPPLPKG